MSLRWFNTASHYGLVAIIMHWLMAMTVIGLFALGWWMTELTYYDVWYRRGPELHKAIGIILFGVWVLRLSWRQINAKPSPLAHHKPWEIWAAKIAHLLLYLLMLLVFVSGYMISTADGRSIEVFGLFSVPAFVTAIENQEDLAGDIHFYLACSLIGLALIHGIAAIQHHLFDQDNTLRRMFNPNLKD